MANYKLSKAAKEDLIRIHHYGVQRFGMQQADAYFSSFFDHFEMIARIPFSCESVDFIKQGYRRCVCGSDAIYYKVNNKQVEIMAVIGKQDLENKL